MYHLRKHPLCHTLCVLHPSTRKLIDSCRHSRRRVRRVLWHRTDGPAICIVCIRLLSHTRRRWRLLWARHAIAALRLLRICQLGIGIIERLCLRLLSVGIIVTIRLRRHLLDLLLRDRLLLMVVLRAGGWLLRVLLHRGRRGRALLHVGSHIVVGGRSGLVALFSSQAEPNAEDDGG